MSTSEITKMEEGDLKAQTKSESGFCGSPEVVQIIQKVHILIILPLYHTITLIIYSFHLYSYHCTIVHISLSLLMNVLFKNEMYATGNSRGDRNILLNICRVLRSGSE
jgi:hypothetical protein